MSNKNVAVLGSQFGDEAKAKIAHSMAKDFRYVVRFSGSSNAGHTIYHEGQKVVRRLLPAADFSFKDHYAFLGAGMVINPDELIKEIYENKKIFPELAKQVIVDPNAFVITQKHLEEDLENVKKIGSTGKGVSPAYRDKIYRCGTRIMDLIKENNHAISVLKNMGVQFKTSFEMYDELVKSRILFEGAQSILLDYNYGTYPYVTSGECGLNGIMNAGFAFAMPSKVIGIIKAYMTRVGHGPFPTEIIGEEADKLRSLGKEYGAVTGRPRRIGWLDLPALDYVIKVSGVNNLIVTKLDVLNNYGDIKICHKYDKPIASASDLFDIKPEYITYKSWSDAKDISQVHDFVNIISKIVKVPITHISYGVNKEDILCVNSQTEFKW